MSLTRTVGVIRQLSKSSLNLIKQFSTESVKVKLTDSEIQLYLKEANSGPLVVHNFWLRDNCSCPKCFNSSTWQRYTDLLSIPLDVKAESVTAMSDGQKLSVRWSDGHDSVYDIPWILGVFGKRGGKEDIMCYSNNHETTLWGGREMNARGGLPTVPKDTLEAGGDIEVIRNLLKFGVCAISGVSADPNESKAACSKVSLLQNNVYGDFWVINPLDKSEDHHADTAYTTEALSAHTDGTYSRNTPGLQAFHILDVPPSGGGKTLLVDGFNVAERLRAEDKAAFDFLASNPIHHHSIDGRYHLRSFEPVIKVSASGQLEQVRFNPYDRSPITHFSSGELSEFYRSYRALVKLMRDPSSEFWVQLDTTTLLLTNNWRVLHGRSAFNGKRTLSGCYLSRDEFLSKARILGVL